MKTAIFVLFVAAVASTVTASNPDPKMRDYYNYYDPHRLEKVNATAVEILRTQLMKGETPDGIPCNICTAVVGFLVGKITKYGCGLIFDGLAAAACEAAGLGPEDPLSEVCIAFAIASCGEIAKLIAEHVSSPQTICSDLHVC